MKIKLIFYFICIFSILAVQFIPIKGVNAQDNSTEESRELEIGVYDDYAEIMSYKYLVDNQTEYSSELEIRMETQGSEGAISLELEYYSEVVTANGSSEAGLYFRVTFQKLIEYSDDNEDGIYNPESDTVVKSVLLGDRGIEMYSFPTAEQITIDGIDGYKISVNGTIPYDSDLFNFNILGYIFENSVTLNGLEISATEFKFDIEIMDFPFDSLDNMLALETILITEIEVEVEQENGNNSFSIESNSISGAFSWEDNAMVDGVSKPITESSIIVDDEHFIYLCYEAGSSIIHDPSLEISKDILAKFPDPGTELNFQYIKIIILSAIGLLVIGIIMTKTEFRSYILNRNTYLDKGFHKLSIENVLENQFRSKIIDLIIDNPGIHYKELFRQVNTSPSNLAWHLEILFLYKIIKKQREGRYLIYFTIIDKNPFDNFNIDIAKSETTLKIYRYILDNPGDYLNKISKNLEIHYKTTKYHIKKLINTKS